MGKIVANPDGSAPSKLSASADIRGQKTDGRDKSADAIEVVPVPTSEVLPELSRTLATMAQACRELEAARLAAHRADEEMKAALDEAIELRLNIRDVLITEAQEIVK